MLKTAQIVAIVITLGFSVSNAATSIWVAGDSRIATTQGICQKGGLLDMLKKSGYTAQFVSVKCLNYAYNECGANTTYGLSLKDWIGKLKGLQYPPDILYWSAGLDDIDGMESTANITKRLSDYRLRLNEALDLFKSKAPAMKVVFSTQLPVKNCPTGRRNEDIIMINDIAKDVCKKRSIAVHDLYKVAIDRSLNPGNDCRHFASSSNKILAEDAKNAIVAISPTTSVRKFEASVSARPILFTDSGIRTAINGRRMEAPWVYSPQDMLLKPNQATGICVEDLTHAGAWIEGNK